MDTITVTKEIIRKLTVGSGHIDRETTVMLGEDPDNLQKGWTKKAVGREIPKSFYDAKVGEIEHGGRTLDDLMTLCEYGDCLKRQVLRG
jgi:hypothetical protein